jgi:hypothetical protein
MVRRALSDLWWCPLLSHRSCPGGIAPATPPPVVTRDHFMIFLMNCSHQPTQPTRLHYWLPRAPTRHNVPHTPHWPFDYPHASPRAVGGRGCHRALRLQSHVSIRGTTLCAQPLVAGANRVFSSEKKAIFSSLEPPGLVASILLGELSIVQTAAAEFGTSYSYREFASTTC